MGHLAKPTYGRTECTCVRTVGGGWVEAIGTLAANFSGQCHGYVLFMSKIKTNFGQGEGRYVYLNKVLVVFRSFITKK